MEEQQVEVQDVKQDTAPTASEEKQPVNQVPYARFSELVDEKNTLKVELDSLKKNAQEETESRKLKQMEEKGEYDKIMTEMKTKLEVAEKKAEDSERPLQASDPMETTPHFPCHCCWVVAISSNQESRSWAVTALAGIDHLNALDLDRHRPSQRWQG